METSKEVGAGRPTQVQWRGPQGPFPPQSQDSPKMTAQEFKYLGESRSTVGVGMTPHGSQGTSHSEELSPPHLPRGPVADTSLGVKTEVVSHQGHKVMMPWL